MAPELSPLLDTTMTRPNTTHQSIDSDHTHHKFCEQTWLLMQVRPSSDCVKPDMQPPHRTPERLPLHSGLGLGAFDMGGGSRHERLSAHPQYPAGHRLALVRGTFVTEFEFENAAQNPLVTFTNVVQAVIPNGQFVNKVKRMH
jgi:hypothetical protein